MSGRRTIEVWMADLTFPGYMDRLHRLAGEFEKLHPEYEVAIRGTDFRMMSKQLAEAAARDEAPTIAEYYFYMTPQARDATDTAGRPLYTSVERAIGGRTEILGEPVVVDDIVPAIRRFYTYDGELISMPTVGTTMLLFGNRSLMSAAGLPGLPETWQDLALACARVRALPDGPAHGVTWANHGFFVQDGLAVQGATLGDHNDGRDGRTQTVDLLSPQMLTYLRWWQRMHQDGHYLYTGKIPDWVNNLRAFAEQDVAFRITSSADINYMVQSGRQGGFEIEVGRHPYPEGTPYGGHLIAGTSLWLRAGLDEVTRDGALAFLQFLHNPENAADQHRVNSFLPLTGASFALLEEEGWFEANPQHRVASEQIRDFPAGADRPAGEDVPVPRGAMIGDYAGIQDVMTLAIADVLLDGADPETRFGQAQADAQRLLDAYLADCAEGGPSRPESLRMEYFRDAEAYTAASQEAVVQLKEGSSS